MIDSETALYEEISKRLEGERGPLNIRLRRALSSTIKDGVIGGGEVLPPEREFADRLNISRSTVRQCLKALVEGGVLRTLPGVGTVVIDSIPKALSRLSAFSEDMLQRGLTPTSKVLELSFGPVSTDTAFRTGLPLRTQVLPCAVSPM